MVSLNEVNCKRWYIDTSDCRRTMYRAINWMPPYLIGVEARLKLPPVVFYEGETYVLKDENSLNRHYEVENGNTK